MTWSYVLTSLGPPLGKDAIRFFLGDTDSNYPQLQDEEINFALTMRGNAYGGAAMCAQALAAKYSRLVNTSADGVSQGFAQKSVAYQRIALEYLEKETIHYAGGYAGGTSKSDMRAQLGNGDRVPDIFRFGMFDDPPNDGVNTAIDEPGGGPYPPGNTDAP